jgi:hypothetical protein
MGYGKVAPAPVKFVSALAEPIIAAARANAIAIRSFIVLLDC